MEKGEVNQTEMNELERGIEKLEDNTDDCCKELQALRYLKKVSREGGKDELNFMVETTKYFEDATMYNHPKVVKVNMSSLNDQKRSHLHDFNNLQCKKCQRISVTKEKYFKHQKVGFSN